MSSMSSTQSSQSIDPLKIMQLSKDYTFEQLRANYKRLVLEYHPDRKQDLSNSPVFQTLKFSYDYLMNDLKSRELDKDHNTLKSQAMSQKDTFKGQTNIKISKERFDLDKFNQMFSDSRMQDVYDDGYGDWDDSKPMGQKAIIMYKEPEPLSSSRFASAYELGATKIDDYSHDNVGAGLRYMDLKLAHSTTMLVDPDHVVQRQEFKTVDELKKHRGNVDMVASPDDLARQHAIKKEMEKKEADRLAALKNKDSLIEQLYNKTHKLMLAAFS